MYIAEQKKFLVFPAEHAIIFYNQVPGCL